MSVLVVGLGGFVGAILRYSICRGIEGIGKGAAIPIGTAAVNIIGCLLIGLLAGWVHNTQALSENARLFVFVGLLASFTTFSTFGNDTFLLLKGGKLLLGLANAGIHMFVGLAAVAAGHAIANALQKSPA
jgi:CrcB protein